MNHYHKIADYLHFLINHYNLHVCVKDFCGFLPINKELDEALRPFLAHTNPFCMYIKQDREKYRICVSQIKKMFEKSEHNQRWFYGICHAGLGEYVIPICYHEIVMGTVNIGFFQSNELRTQYLIERSCRDSELLNSAVAMRLYRQNIRPPRADATDILPCIEMLAEYLGNTYQALLTTHQQPERMRYHSSEDTIITHAIEYIRQHSKTRIIVAEIAEFCHCSESYLSRIFKKRTGVNINVYVNKVRVELSKNYLLLTTDTIAQIALSLGFGDPNYFSRVFTALIGHSPSEFRRRFKDQAIVSGTTLEDTITHILQNPADE